MERKLNTKAKIQRAKELRRSMTYAETLLWGQLRRNQLGGLHSRRQQVIEGFIADFYCFRAKLIIEVDGEVHEFSGEADKLREEALNNRGFRIIIIRNHEIINNKPSVIDRILKACNELGPTTPRVTLPHESASMNKHHRGQGKG